jgi:hypothetical protein
MEMNNLHMHAKDLDFLKSYFTIIIHSFEDGACFFITDLDKVTFKLADKFDIPGLEVGSQYSKSGIAAQTIQAEKVIAMQLARNVYGVRVHAFGGPVWDESDTEIVGAWILALPRQHKLVNAFDSFAPIMTGLLPEGGFLYCTDREKYICRQGSKKFDIPDLQIDTSLREGSVPVEALKQKKPASQELDDSIYGIPVLASAFPLMDEESGEFVGTFGIGLPRQLANNLKEIAQSLDQGLTGVSASVQQITAATNDVSGNQSHLHEEIENVKGKLDNINNVMSFIKEIADETKMLGLNAAIEAARVGEAGMGFGVVAEEIRKLSEESKKTVTQIKELTKTIEKSMNETSTASQSTLAVVEETSAAIQEVNATIEEMTSLSNKLASTAGNL